MSSSLEGSNRYKQLLLPGGRKLTAVVSPHPFSTCASLLVAVGVCLSAASAAANEPADFGQVRELIQANLPGVTKAELNQSAVDGLLQGFRGKVRLLSPAAANAAAPEKISQSLQLDDGIAYLRIPNIAAGLAPEVTALCQAMNATNRLKGVVFDLRFGGGDDYAAAAGVADLFVREERALLDWGEGVVKSTAKTNAFAWPVVVLVNGETAGAPEALAALMRETGTGLILGNLTRGAAMTTKDFPLANGQILRIAASPVKLGGETALPSTGITPDILVTVTTAEERLYFADPYAVLGKPAAATNVTAVATNRVTRRTRTSEADLVRARREGLNPDAEVTPPRAIVPEQPVLRDPALARAVDLLKGLAVVRRGR